MSKYILIDPPSGWKYGFPKKIKKEELENNDLSTILLKYGYPQKEIDSLGDALYVQVTEINKGDENGGGK